MPLPGPCRCRGFLRLLQNRVMAYQGNPTIEIRVDINKFQLSFIAAQRAGFVITYKSFRIGALSQRVKPPALFAISS